MARLWKEGEKSGGGEAREGRDESEREGGRARGTEEETK